MASISWKDLRDSAEAGPKPIPVGKYDAIVERCDVKETKAGKVMFAAMFKIASGPEQGSTIWTNLVVSPESPRALGILFQQFDALGLGASFFAGNPTDEQIADAINGQPAKIAIKLGEWDGMPRPEVSRIERSPAMQEKSVPTGTAGLAPDEPF